MLDAIKSDQRPNTIFVQKQHMYVFTLANNILAELIAYQLK